MPHVGAGHKPESLALGAALSTLSFLCVAVMSALAKATEELTSSAVVLLFQNLICLLFLIPVPIHGGWASLRTEKSASISFAPGQRTEMSASDIRSAPASANRVPMLKCWCSGL